MQPLGISPGNSNLSDLQNTPFPLICWLSADDENGKLSWCKNNWLFLICLCLFERSHQLQLLWNRSSPVHQTPSLANLNGNLRLGFRLDHPGGLLLPRTPTETPCGSASLPVTLTFIPLPRPAGAPWGGRRNKRLCANGSRQNRAVGDCLWRPCWDALIRPPCQRTPLDSRLSRKFSVASS